MDIEPRDHQKQSGGHMTRHLLCLSIVLVMILTLWLSGYSLSSSLADVSPLEPISLPSPQPAPPDRSRLQVIAYVVQSGDTLASIAEQFALQRETIVWSNPELEPDPAHVYPGQVLNILPVDGVYHLVSRGETLASLAQQYQVSVEAIACFRGNWSVLGQDGVWGCADPLAPEVAAVTVPVARPGTALIVPGGVKAYRPTFVRFQTGRIVRVTPEAEKSFVWPARGPISQEYWDLHRAIDIAGEHGQVVTAAEAGIVTYAEWEISGYGYLVVVDHGEGLVSYYGHLYGFYVDVGQFVRRGEPLGVIGNTGRSTGPHLHFEVRCDGVPCDPYAYLSPE